MEQKEVCVEEATDEQQGLVVHKDVSDEAVQAVTRRVASFTYTFSYAGNDFAGLDVLIMYEEIDDYGGLSNLRKVVTGFDVDGNTVVPDLDLLKVEIEQLLDNYMVVDEIVDPVSGRVAVSQKEKTGIIKRVMHNVNHFIHSNEMTLGE